MIKKALKPILSFSLLIVSIGIFLGSSALLFVVTGPRSLPYVSERIEQTLNHFSPNFDIKIGDAVLRWDGIKEGLGIHITNVGITEKDKRSRIALFPDIKVRLSITALLLGSIELQDVVISASEFKIKWDAGAESEDAIIGPHPISIYRQAIVDILSAIEKNNKKIPIKNIKMEQVRIILSNGTRDTAWFLQEVEIAFLVVGDVVTFNTDIKATFSGSRLRIKSEGFLEDKSKLRLKTKFSDLPPFLIADVFPEFGWASKIDMLFSGNTIFLFDEQGAIKYADFHIDSSKRYISLSKPKLEFKGKFDVHEKFEAETDVPEFHGSISIANMPMDSLELYWPGSVASSVREWIVSSISRGIYSKADIEINISPEEFLNKELQDDSIRAILEFNDAEIDYYSELPKIENASGVAKFSSNYIDIDVNGASVKNTRLQKARVQFFDIDDEEKANILIEGKASGETEDLAAFFLLESGDIQGAEKYSNVTGKAETDFTFSFPIKETVSVKDVKFEAASKLSETKIPDIKEGLGLSDGVFSVKINNDELKSEGKGFLNGLHTEINYHQDFSGNQQYYDKTSLKTYATAKELEIFGVPDMGVINGGLFVDLEITNNNKGTKNIVGRVDVTGAEIDAPVIGLKKPAKEALSLAFIMNDKGKEGIDVSSIVVNSDKISARGTAEFSSDYKGYSEIYLEEVKFADNKFALVLARNFGNYYRAHVKGESMDVSPLLENFSKIKSDGDPFGLTVDTKLKRLILSDGVEINDFSGGFKCLVEMCVSADFSGDFKEGGKVKMTFGPNEKTDEDENRYFYLTSDNAGLLLKGLGIIKHIKGGIIEADAVTKNEKESPTTGKLIAKDFMVIKAPVLTKLLTLTSFTGILELLNGQGISFDEAKGEFNFKDSKLTLVGLRAHGGSLGITVDGDIDTKDSSVDLDGAVVPAYTLNKIIGNVPLVGTFLIGGEGGGLIATRYKIKGKYPDPEVTANPLSMLTPGFLRGIWGGKAAEYKEEKKKEEKELKEKQKETIGLDESSPDLKIPIENPVSMPESLQ